MRSTGPSGIMVAYSGGMIALCADSQHGCSDRGLSPEQRARLLSPGRCVHSGRGRGPDPPNRGPARWRHRACQ